MSNVIDFPANPVPDDPEAPGKPGPDILNTPVTGAFSTGAVKARDSRLTFLSPGEFCEFYSRRDWLINGVIERGMFGQLFGASQTLKSFLAIDMGLCVAANMPWHGHLVRQGAVAYVCGEGRGGLAKRLKVWGQHWGVTIEYLPFLISSQPALFCDKNSAFELSVELSRKAMSVGQFPELVIIDTLARSFGGDENSTKDMNEFIQHIDAYLRCTFGCTVLLIHHVGHKAQDRGRGSSALHAALDFELHTDRADDLLTVTCTKSKDDEAMPRWHFEAQKVTLAGADASVTSLVLVPTTRHPAKGAKRKLSPTQESYLRALNSYSPNGVCSFAAFKGYCKENGIADAKRFPELSRSLAYWELITCSPELDSVELAAGGRAKLQEQVK